MAAYRRATLPGVTTSAQLLLQLPVVAVESVLLALLSREELRQALGRSLGHRVPMPLPLRRRRNIVRIARVVEG